jgi:hypothetical protein
LEWKSRDDWRPTTDIFQYYFQNMDTTTFIPDRTYPNEPYSWEKLVGIITVQKDLSLLARSREQEIVYQAYKLELERKWATVYDMILCTKFQFDQRHSCNDSTGVVSLYAHPQLSVAQQIRVEKRLCLNDFPYFMMEGLEHWILWKLGEPVTEADVLDAKENLSNMTDTNGELTDTLHWINPPHLKSLPDIDHVHILCKRGPKSPSSR